MNRIPFGLPSKGHPSRDIRSRAARWRSSSPARKRTNGPTRERTAPGNSKRRLSTVVDTDVRGRELRYRRRCRFTRTAQPQLAMTHLPAAFGRDHPSSRTGCPETVESRRTSATPMAAASDNQCSTSLPSLAATGRRLSDCWIFACSRLDCLLVGCQGTFPGSEVRFIVERGTECKQ